MSRPEPDGADEAHDAWLREALRHAPDAAAAPPAAVRASILAEARAATATRVIARPGLAEGIAWLWAALARPPVAAGFASVMAATLVGMLWWDRPIDDTLPAAPPPQSIEPALPRAAAPTTPQAATPPATPAPRVVTDAPGSLADRPAAEPRRKDAAAPPVATPPMAESPRAFPVPAREAAPAPADRRAESQMAEKKERADSLAKLRSAPAVRPNESVARDTGQKSVHEVPAAQPAAPEARSQSEAAAPAQPFPSGSGFAGAAPAAAAKPAPAMRAADPLDAARRDSAAGPRGRVAPNASADESESSRQRLAAAAPAEPMAALRAALAAEPARWSRQGEGGDGAVDPALQAWLARFDAAARSAWRRASGREAQADAAPAPVGRSLRLLRDGQVVATLRLDADRAGLESGLGAAVERWSAPLAPGAAERLLATLPAAPR